MAKRFYLLLYLFLKRNYERTEIVFIRHHTVAKEVDEQEFFYSRETGGTVVSSALKLMTEIIAERYSPNEWNIYGAQASDGDNWNDDSPLCVDVLKKGILPHVQYFSYVEITRRDPQALWNEYQKLADAHARSVRAAAHCEMSRHLSGVPGSVPEKGGGSMTTRIVRAPVRTPISTGSEWTFELIHHTTRKSHGSRRNFASTRIRTRSR